MQELINIQSELNAPKNLFNKFGNYKYRSCESIVEALKPLMKKYGCYLTITDKVVNIGERFYIEATVTITNKEGQAVSTSAYAREEESKKGMDASQLTGATSSYARKYALNGLFAIDDTKDADATNTHEEVDKSAIIEMKKRVDSIMSIDELKNYYELNKEDIDAEVAYKKIITQRKQEILRQNELEAK